MSLDVLIIQVRIALKGISFVVVTGPSMKESQNPLKLIQSGINS